MSELNIGWLYSKGQYGVELLRRDGLASLEDIQRKLLGHSLRNLHKDALPEFLSEEKVVATHKIKMLVSGKGFMSGTGKFHDSEDTSQLVTRNSLAVEYCNGLPKLSGSSLKGILRSHFPSELRTREEIEFLQSLIKALFDKAIDLDQLKVLELEIFEGKNQSSTYCRDQFLGATILLDKKNINKPLFQLENINRHPDDYTKPTVLGQLVVRPRIIFRFEFRLFDGDLLEANQKEELFKALILYAGAGAKTNGGYSQFLLEEQIQDSQQLNRHRTPRR